MPSFTSSDRAQERSWREIDELVEEILECSRTAKERRAFYHQLLSRLNDIFAGAVASVWRFANGNWELDQQLAVSGRDFGPRQDPLPSFESVRRARQPASFEVSGEESYLLGPVLVGDRCVAILEIDLPFVVPAETRRNQIELLASLCELAADFELRQPGDRADFDAFLEIIHRSLELEETCFSIANESRLLLSVDRVSVLVRRGSRFRLQAVSGIDEIDRRADGVRTLEQLAQRVARGGEPVWQDASTPDLPTPVEEALDQHADASSARAVAVVPLTKPTSNHNLVDESHAILAFERFSAAEWNAEERRTIGLVARYAAPALQNAMTHSNVPRVVRRLAKVGGRLSAARGIGIAAVALLLIGGIVGAMTVQTDYYVRCRGELSPTRTRHVFAPSDGTVERILVDTNDRVAAGTELLVVRNAKLEYERTRLEGTLRTNQARLQAIRSQLATRPDDRLLHLRLSAEQTEVQAAILGLEQQLASIREREGRQTLQSPIAGTVLTTDLTQLLGSRPVRRGQRMLTVADTGGEWRLNLRISDADIGKVRQAIQRPDSAGTLPVSFLLLTDPRRTHSAQLTELSNSTETDEVFGSYVRGHAKITETAGLDLHVGAEIVAKVHCGSRPIAVAWFDDVIDVVRTRLLF